MSKFNRDRASCCKDGSLPGAALDQPEEPAPERCPLGRKVHRPHTWTGGGPLKNCPGVSAEPEEGS